MSSRSTRPSLAQQAPGAVEPERVVRVRKQGSGQQLEIQWRGQQATTWEAASRMYDVSCCMYDVVSLSHSKVIDL